MGAVEWLDCVQINKTFAKVLLRKTDNQYYASKLASIVNCGELLRCAVLATSLYTTYDLGFCDPNAFGV